MENLNDIAKEIENVKEVAISILKDTLVDYKKDGFRKTITIWLLIIALVGTFIFSLYNNDKANKEYQANITQLAEENDKRFKDFLSEYDLEVSYEYNAEASADNGSSIENSGNIIPKE